RGGVGVSGIADVAAGVLLALKSESRLLLRAIDDKGYPYRLPAVARIESADANVTVAVYAAAFGKLLHDAGRIAQIEHRQPPHLPIGVARMGIVGEFDVHRPSLFETILDLRRDLIVGQVRQE